MQSKFIYLPVYLSDYVSEARKLSMIQRGAYIDLACLYFQEDLKLEYSKEQIYRMVFAFEQQERDAVDFILKNYFVESENKPMGSCWVSSSLNEIGARVLKRLDANRNNGKLGGRGNKKENKPMGSELVNPTNNPNESILNESKLNQIKLKENNNKLKGSIKEEYLSLADGLIFVLEAKINKTFSNSIRNSWGEEIRKLVEIDLKNRNTPLADVKIAIQAIADNYGKEYFPVIQSGSSLREKITKIENYLQRNITTSKPSSETIFNHINSNY